MAFDSDTHSSSVKSPTIIAASYLLSNPHSTGLVPIVGDVTNIGLNYFLVVRKAKQAE